MGPPPPTNSTKVSEEFKNDKNKALNINVSNLNDNELDGRRSIKRETSHGRFHTALGTPSDHKSIDSDVLNIDQKRRKSENALVKFKVASPLSDRSQLFGYERKKKLVCIADLMLPDVNVDKLRAISRRGSKTSNYDPYTSPIPYQIPRNRTISTDAHSIHLNINENIKIDPMDPMAFDDLQFAKSSLYNEQHTKNQSVTTSKLAQMVKKQEDMHEANKELQIAQQNNILAIDDSLHDKSKAVHFEDIDGPDLIEENLRDFKSEDGKITYTEIEVGVLGSGNFFGETLLIEDEMNGNDDDDIDDEAMNDGNMKGSKMMNLLNSNSNKKDETSPTLKKKKSKKKIDADSKSYRGTHTTFRCMTGCVIYSITKQSLDEFFRRVPSARPWFDIMLSKYNVSLDTVLHIPRAARYFTLFLESEYAEENVHYVLAVNEYKNAWNNLDDEHRMEMATIICSNFIDDEGKQQINVSYSQRKGILERIKDGDIDFEMFDVTQKAIYILLERDCFPRFNQSHFFHEFLNEAENLALLTKEQYEEQQRMMEVEEEEMNDKNKKIKKESYERLNSLK